MARVALEIAEVVYGRMGMFRYVSGLLPALLRVGTPRHEFHLFSAVPSRGADSETLSLLRDLPATLHLTPIPPRIFEALRHFQALVPLEWFTGNVDLVHTQAFSLLPPPRRAPLIVALHGISPLRTPGFYSRRFLNNYVVQIKHALRHADYIVALTEENKLAMTEILGIPPPCIRVIPPGIDPMFRPLQPGEEMAGALAAGTYLLYAGHLGPHKNVGTLLRAYALLPASLRADFPLVLAGSGDPAEFGWRDLGRTLGIADQVRWLGHLPSDAVPPLMRSARLFLFPSFCEGFALPPLEAMASGVPVLASNASSLPETVGDAGRLLPPDDPAAWAAAMGQILSDDHAREELAKRGLAWSARFRWDETAHLLLNLWADLLDGELARARDIWPKQERCAPKLAIGVPGRQ